jgi:4-alpha-glucanotransferase
VDVPAALAKWGILSSKVMVFERDFHTGRYRSAQEYMRMALATVNTHDLPPLAGWMEERDINIRAQVGDLADPAMANSIRSSRHHERSALIQLLIEAGLLPANAHHGLEAHDLIKAVHAFIRRTPSALVALSLDDLALEVAPVNIPGVWQDKYPSWSRRMRRSLEEILSSPNTRHSLGTEA